ncbi:MAG TPA: hypothetical protein VFT74_12960 [Isosphaeraceae bacterium]|nr:hypothetical protein [Isosphaeraceae bacterium]
MSLRVVHRWPLLLALALVPSVLLAQSQPSASSPKPIRRVPMHFGQVGLTPSQRERIYEIRTRHHERIEALNQEIARLEAAETTECEAVLTEAQRRLLAHSRAAARARSLTRKTASSANSPRANP